MGTNFYWLIDPETMEPWNDIDEDDVHRHIGKRSYAGAYCDKCGISLSTLAGMSSESCPVCGKSWNDVASSFTWTMMRHKIALESFARAYPDKKVCCDEYGNGFTSEEMLREADCKIVYQCADRFY